MLYDSGKAISRYLAGSVAKRLVSNDWPQLKTVTSTVPIRKTDTAQLVSFVKVVNDTLCEYIYISLMEIVPGNLVTW